MLLATLHSPLAGSYSSAVLDPPKVVPSPPATSTLPRPGSKVAVAWARLTLRLPVPLQPPLAGSNNSAVAVVALNGRAPLATRTPPFGSNVAIAMERPVARLPVVLHVPVAESYSSAL